MLHDTCYMKIGIDIRTLMDAQYSGVSEYTYNLVKNLLEEDTSTGSAHANEYSLFYNSFRNVDERIPKFEGNYKIVKTKYPNKIFNFLLQTIFKYPKLDKLLGVNVFIAPNIGFYTLSKKCKKILTIHDLSFLRYPEFFSWKRRLWHRVVNVKKQIKQFDKIVAVSENTKNDLIELCGVSKEKVEVIHSGISENYKLQIANDELEKIKNKYNLSDNFILYLGTVEPRKNIRSIIQAYNLLRVTCSMLRDYKLVIAGGRGWKSKNIHKEWKKSKYKNDIIFAGYIDDKDKPALYNLATIFVYPSFYEGFGFPPLESLACGTPVVTSFASSLPEILGGTGIMIDPYNINGLAKAMEELLLNKELRSDLREKGLEQVKKFNWKNTAKQYLDLIKISE